MPPKRRSRRRGPGTSRRRVLQALGLGAVGAGVGVALGGANAFTTGTIDRQSSATVADDDSAIVGLDVADTVPRGQQAFLAAITNNGTDASAIDVSLDDPAQGTLYGPTGSGHTVTLALDPAETGSVEIQTQEPDGTTIPFTVSRSAPEFSFEIDRWTTVNAGGFDEPVSIELEGSTSTAGNSGQFRFALTNTGTVDVDLVAIGVVETTNDRADYVSEGESLRNRDTGTVYVSDGIPFDSTTSDSTLVSLDPIPRLDHENDGDETPKSISLEFNKFRSNSPGPPADMRGVDVKIELKVRYGSDDSITTGVVNLCSGDCDF